MPELPEVQNTVDGLRETVLHKTISTVWTDYGSTNYLGKQQIKDPQYFKIFKKTIVGCKIVEVSRRAKHIFIHLDNQQIISVHMKMTGHFLFGQWQWNKQQHKWQPEDGFWNKDWDMDKEEVKRLMPLSDPFNDFIHLMIGFSDGTQLALSDMRKFASVSLIDSQQHQELLDYYGPEPLQPRLSFESFVSRLKNRPNKKVKTALLDQSLVAGFGNIYTDEALFAAGIHPESIVSAIPESYWRDLFHHGKRILRLAVKHGGDSTGDYRRIDGSGGTFNNMHQVYRRDGQVCHSCDNIIEKKQIDQRIGRYCPGCQKLFI